MSAPPLPATSGLAALKTGTVKLYATQSTVKLPRFRRVVLDLGDYGSLVTASIAAS